MKKMVTSILLITFTVITTSVFWNRMESFGAQKNKTHLEKLRSHRNFKNNTFHNTVPTSMDFPPGKVMKEMVKNDRSRKPEEPLETVKVTPESFTGVDTLDTKFIWFGHSTLMSHTQGVTILFDPIFSQRASLVQFAGPKKFPYTNDYSPETIPTPDVVVISHDHYDHLDHKAIQYYKDRVKLFLVPTAVAPHLIKWGVDASKIIELNWNESYRYKNIEFKTFPTRHFSGRRTNNRNQTLWCGWMVKTDNTKFIFSGDSGYFPGFAEVGKSDGPFDIAFIECGQYSQYWPNIHMKPEESVQAGIDFNSKVIMPIHWGKFKLSIHAWNEPPQRFMKKANEEQLKAIIPQIGEMFTINSKLESNWWK